MTTRAEEIAGEWPYKVEPYPDPKFKSFFNIAGPGREPILFGEEEDAQERRDELNAAYLSGKTSCETEKCVHCGRLRSLPDEPNP